MRHQKYKYKLGVSPSHRKSMMKNLSIDLIKHGQIKTTITRCRALKIFIERLITKAKTDNVANRRLMFKKLNNKDAVKRLFVAVSPKMKDRPGGYTRITKLADRRVGDNAKLSYISFVEKID